MNFLAFFWKVMIESFLQARVGRWLVIASASGNISWSVQIQNVQVCVYDVSLWFTKQWRCCLRAISFSSHVCWAQAIQLSYKSFCPNTQYPLLCWSSLPLFFQQQGMLNGKTEDWVAWFYWPRYPASHQPVNNIVGAIHSCRFQMSPAGDSYVKLPQRFWWHEPFA